MANYQSTHTGQEHDAYCTKSQLINLVYPVGSIYMSINSTSPQTLFGGTWQQISDTFLLAAGSTYTAGSTGGEATHTLVVNEMPVHDGHINGNARPTKSLVTNGDPTTNYYLNGTAQTGKSNYGWVVNHSNEAYPATLNAGGGGAHNNMPPYLAVYVWKRTA